MVRSMTGFGRGMAETDQYKITVEIKSVNHRYLDTSIKIPKKLGCFESSIRSYLKKYITRGKIDVFIMCEDETEGKNHLTYHPQIAASYYRGLEQLSNDLAIPNPITAYELARFPDVFVLEEQATDEKVVEQLLFDALTLACESFLESRSKEGNHLIQDMNQKLSNILEAISYIEERSPNIMKEYRERLLEKVHELLEDRQINESVLATELIVFADKICVDEEIVRLKSHTLTMENTLMETDSVGRKLDFIAQEMNREANTILSKANDMEVSNHAIGLKTEIEKIREQIQNIE